ncbi:MAG: hypothetical protein AAF360_19865, partial [Pseudomonadota bacterium]
MQISDVPSSNSPRTQTLSRKFLIALSIALLPIGLIAAYLPVMLFYVESRVAATWVVARAARVARDIDDLVSN